MATRPQIAMIHTLKSKIGLADDHYRAVLGSFGAESSKDLSTVNAKSLIKTLMGMITGSGATAGAGFQKRYADSNEVATYAQQAKIRHLWNAVSRVSEKDRARALDAFLEKRFQISFLKWLPRERVGKVIHTLEAMQKQPVSAGGHLDVQKK